MRKKNNTLGIIIALVAVLFAGGVYLATKNPADATGTISGYVNDASSGNPIQGVDVIAIDEDGKKYTSSEYTDTTDKSGFFELNLPAGDYNIQFESIEYGTLISEDFYTVKEDGNNKISKAFSMELPIEKTADETAVVEKEVEQQTLSEIQPTEPIENNDVHAKFTINPNQEEDYSQNLDPTKYYSYYSDTEEFFFSYPPNLYNYVESNTSNTVTPLGTNIETHSFRGDGGSSLTFSLYKRDENLNLSGAKDKALASESEGITRKKNILLDELNEKTGRAKVVVSGYNSVGNVVYKLIMITPSNEMIMSIENPPYKDKDDKLMKGYVIECIYRYCGFASDEASPPRSYKEYVKEQKK